MSNKPTIEWPKDDHIVEFRKRTNIVATIQNFFANTGIIVSILYVLVRQVIAPCLESHYTQRVDFSAQTLIQLRRLVVTLQDKLVYTPLSAVGFNESDGEVERSTQTSDDEKILIDKSTTCRWNRFNDRLKEVQRQVERFNTKTIDSSDNMDSFHFQMKLVVDGIKATGNQDDVSERCGKIVDSVREAKGQVINGRFQ